MPKKQFQYLESNHLKLAYLGEITSNKVLLFLGRGNQQKNSIPLQELLNRLTLNGYLLAWPESRNQAISKFLDEKSERPLCWVHWVCGANETLLKKNFRRYIKGLTLIFYPSKWGFFLNWCANSEVDNQTQLAHQAIKIFEGDKSISILSHSAGGIAASNLWDEPNIKNIICFGYPFKHPDKDDEDYRTRNLKKIEKPFLIIQGNQDEYGGGKAEQHYELSSYIKFEFVDATHEYENLSHNDWANVTQRIESFLNC